MIRGDRRKRVEVLEANHPPKMQVKDDEAMTLIWEVLEHYPKVKAELEKVKGIRDLNDDEAVPHLLEVVDNYPAVKAELVKRLKEDRKNHAHAY